MTVFFAAFGEKAVPSVDRTLCQACDAKLTATPCCPKCSEPNPGWPAAQKAIRARRVNREKRLGGHRHV